MSRDIEIDRAFGRLDDVLAASVPLPSVDEVINRAASVRRASSAAAAAVLTVGSLGGITAIATAAPQEVPAGPASTVASPSTAGAIPAQVPSAGQPALPPAFDPTGATSPFVAPDRSSNDAAVPGARPAPRGGVALPGPAPAPGPGPRPGGGPPPGGGDEGTKDPTPPTSSTPPESTPSDPPPSTTTPPPSTTKSSSAAPTTSTTETTPSV